MNDKPKATIPVMLIAFFVCLICGLIIVLPRALPYLIWLFGFSG